LGFLEAPAVATGVGEGELGRFLLPFDAVTLDAVPLDAVPLDVVPLDAAPLDAVPFFCCLHDSIQLFLMVATSSKMSFPFFDFATSCFFSENTAFPAPDVSSASSVTGRSVMERRRWRRIEKEPPAVVYVDSRSQPVTIRREAAEAADGTEVPIVERRARTVVILAPREWVEDTAVAVLGEGEMVAGVTREARREERREDEVDGEARIDSTDVMKGRGRAEVGLRPGERSAMRASMLPKDATEGN